MKSPPLSYSKHYLLVLLCVITPIISCQIYNKIVLESPFLQQIYNDDIFFFEEGVQLKKPIEIGENVISDRFNNIWSQKDPEPSNKQQASANALSLPTNCSSGFILEFEDVNNNSGIGFDDPTTTSCNGITITLGEIRRNTACAVFDYIAQVIDLNVSGNNPTPTIYFSTSQLDGSGPIGTGSPLYGPPVFNSFEGGFLKDHMVIGIDPAPTDPDAIINIDFGPRIVSGTTINYNSCHHNCSSGEIDLFSLILHEATHALGFASFINADGTSTRTGSLNGPYSLYDRHVLGVSLTNMINNSSQFVGNNSDLTSNNCWYNEVSNSLKQPVYTPISWQPGSSCSHFDDVRGNLNYVMKPAGSGENNRFYSQQEMEVLEDLGYTLNSNLILNGSGIYNFPVGQDDYGSTTLGSPITIDVLSNDNDPNGSLAIGNCGIDGCTGSPIGSGIEIINGGGSVTITGGNITFTPSPTFIGAAVLKYCLVDNYTNGSLVNSLSPTYVFIDVTGNYCPDDPCNYVCNGGFELGAATCACLNWSSVGGYPTSVISNWYAVSETPDYLIRGNSLCNPSGCLDWLDINDNLYGEHDTHNGTPNDRYIGLINSSNKESIRTKLINTLIPGNNYLLTFYGRRASTATLGVRIFLNDTDPGNVSGPVLQQFNTLNNGGGPSIQNLTDAWVQYNFPFTAPPNTTGEQYLIIEPDGPAIGYRIIIDDVSIVEATPNNLTITKIINTGTSNLIAGGNVQFDIQICNNTSQSVSNVIVVDYLSPNLSFTNSNFNNGNTQHIISSLSSNGCINLTLNAGIKSTAPLNTDITNCLFITQGATNCQDISSRDNCATFQLKSIDISVTKSSITSSPIVNGDQVSFSLDICNLSAPDANNIILNDLIPAGLQYLSHTFTNGTGNYNPVSGIITIPSLLGQACSSLTITCLVNAVNTPITLQNCLDLVSIQSNQTEINFSNNSSCVDIKIDDCTGLPSSGFDLMIKDNITTDFGLEPNLGDIWSGNIWNCVTPLNCLPPTQPAEYMLSGSNNLRVEIHNVGCGDYLSPPNKASLYLYWTIGRAGEIWPTHWNANTSTISGFVAGKEITPPNTGKGIPSIPSGGSITMSQLWEPPNPANFPLSPGQSSPMMCYLGRIVSANDPMINEVNGPIAPNVKENNNIATINSTLVDLDPFNKAFSSHYFILNNPLEESTELSLVFTEMRNENPSFFERILIEIELYEIIDDEKIEVVDSLALNSQRDFDKLEKRKLKPKENQIVNLIFRLKNRNTTDDIERNPKTFGLQLNSEYDNEKVFSTHFNFQIRIR